MLSAKLDTAEKKVDELLFERAVVKSYISDVNSLLLNIVEDRDPLIPITVQKHLANKLLSTFAMLNRFEGVSEFSSLPEQGGESETPPSKKEPKKANEPDMPKGFESEPKVNVASGSRGKEKVLEEDENEKLKCKACDPILDENMCIA